jgi:hypothetical protein
VTGVAGAVLVPPDAVPERGGELVLALLKPVESVLISPFTSPPSSTRMVP